MSILNIVTEPNKILHEPARRLSYEEILSPSIQKLISDIKETSKSGKYGVALSAMQVGAPVALSVVAIKPTPNHPELEVFNQVCINAEIVETFGDKTLMWEGCCSVLDENNEPFYALVPRYSKIRAHYYDEKGNEHDETFEGFLGHVLQHETDHNNGIMFTDYVDKDALIGNRDYYFISCVERKIKKDFSDAFGKPTDIIGFGKVGKSLAQTLVPIISQKEICFFDEEKKSDSDFHYLDFDKMLEKTEIMIFTTELPEKYFANIAQLNKKCKIYIPKELKDTIALLNKAGLSKSLNII